VALDDLGATEQIALIEVEAELLASLQLLAGLDPFRDQLHAEGGAVPDGIAQLGRSQAEDVELDHGDQLEEGVVLSPREVIVQGERIAVLGQSLAAR
jgi:hypothetical protein